MWGNYSIYLTSLPNEAFSYRGTGKYEIAHWKGGHKARCFPTADRAPNAVAAAAARGGEGECAICLEALCGAAAVKTLPCTHKFHAACVDELKTYGIAQLCPLCRGPLGDSPTEMWEAAARMPTLSMQRNVGVGVGSLPAADQKLVAGAYNLWQAAADQGHGPSLFRIANAHALGRAHVKKDPFASR